MNKLQAAIAFPFQAVWFLAQAIGAGIVILILTVMMLALYAVGGFAIALVILAVLKWAAQTVFGGV